MWLAATLQPGGRKKATANLEAQSCATYSPRFFCDILRKVTDVFPGYILVNTPTDAWEYVPHTRGIASVVKSGVGPSQISNSEIERFKSMEGPDGLCVLPRISAQGRFSPGSRARLRGHYLAGHHGSAVIYQEQLPGDRCAVLLHILGRGVRILVQEEDLEAA